jgi:hypothetical protein
LGFAITTNVGDVERDVIWIIDVTVKKANIYHPIPNGKPLAGLGVDD